MYEHMMRVPLMIRLPKACRPPRAKRVTDVDVVNVDIVPTLRELCGLEAQPSHGVSLLPLLTGKGVYTPREFVVGQYYSKQKWERSSWGRNRHLLRSDYQSNVRGGLPPSHKRYGATRRTPCSGSAAPAVQKIQRQGLCRELLRSSDQWPERRWIPTQVTRPMDILQLGVAAHLLMC